MGTCSNGYMTICVLLAGNGTCMHFLSDKKQTLVVNKERFS